MEKIGIQHSATPELIQITKLLYIVKKTMPAFLGNDNSWTQKNGIYGTSSIPYKSKPELIYFLFFYFFL